MQGIQHRLIIIDDRNLDCRSHGSAPFLAARSLMDTMAPAGPPPICISPPWFSTIDLLNERPTPRPSAFDEVKSAGRRMSTPFGNPGPLSVTVMVTPSPPGEFA